MRRKQATIRDVAKRAGVSIASVSYVLNDTGHVGPEAQGRVMDAVKELNYSANAIAQSLRSSRTKTIGVIVEDLTVFNASRIIDGINEYTNQHGYHIVLGNLRINSIIGSDFHRMNEILPQIRADIDILRSRQLDGFIYVGQHMRDVSIVFEQSLPNIVYVYCYTADPDDYTVNFDDRNAGIQATQHLLGLGHRKIGLIEGLRDSSATQERYEGYTRALQDNRQPLRDEYITYGDWEYPSGYTAASQLLSLPDPPTAVFAMNDLMAIGAMDAARDLDVSVPNEFSVIGFDNREFSCYSHPRLTTISPPLREMGIAAAKHVIDLVQGKKKSQHALTQYCRLIHRDSSVPPYRTK